ncbi:hypothetical protein GUITHDRAFT_151911 [Guillardia theta CCMP2712]|uniref:Uncharacterized protein n=1 Tax=Guillardia theta (strain CCMP2712) TaxID=905079 RepID=L1JIP3_GUITC|nr:hypothetical protein GUITHDRAFT_151911 [Guillardia theta CCMP2712]EKX48024.1 hypothetical protein GUITHDRAFT_151911 [Guillardia theta CCMP2712]|mmetsp:Transcript_9671/g.32361  ORF Transcript_9671/g.32361 Transcript_9671/m.32361 type:complete len:191 (-) Transcript_9671:292-864(-)|eukprot:XP_005835004.1 hypothetical protein GUITHDRAFT_151911 [Guillardia theta CCMP2712]
MSNYLNSSVGGQAANAYDKTSMDIDAKFLRENEILELQHELKNSRHEEERLKISISMQEGAIHRNQQQLQEFRLYMSKRDAQIRDILQAENRRFQNVLEEYKERFARERARLQEAIQTSSKCIRVVSEILPECLAAEKELFETPIESIPRQSVNLPAWTTSLSMDDYSLGGSLGGSMLSEKASRSETMFT